MEELFTEAIWLAILYAIAFVVIIFIVLGIAVLINWLDEHKREREINRYVEDNKDVILNGINPINNNNKSVDNILDNSLQNNNIRRME